MTGVLSGFFLLLSLVRLYDSIRQFITCKHYSKNLHDYICSLAKRKKKKKKKQNLFLPDVIKKCLLNRCFKYCKGYILKCK